MARPRSKPKHEAPLPTEAGVAWEHFEHEADLGVRGTGDTREQAFEGAARALAAIVTDLAAVEPRWSVTIRCDAPDLELLLVDWLNTIIFEMDASKMVFSRFELTIEGSVLTGSAWGERLDATRHPIGVGVKGATFAELEVSREECGRWLAQCVVTSERGRPKRVSN